MPFYKQTSNIHGVCKSADSNLPRIFNFECTRLQKIIRAIIFHISLSIIIIEIYIYYTIFNETIPNVDKMYIIELNL